MFSDPWRFQTRGVFQLQSRRVWLQKASSAYRVKLQHYRAFWQYYKPGQTARSVLRARSDSNCTNPRTPPAPQRVQFPRHDACLPLMLNPKWLTDLRNSACQRARWESEMVAQGWITNANRSRAVAMWPRSSLLPAQLRCCRVSSDESVHGCR